MSKRFLSVVILAAVAGTLLFAGLGLAAAVAIDRGTSYWDPSMGWRRGSALGCRHGSKARILPTPHR